MVMEFRGLPAYGEDRTREDAIAYKQKNGSLLGNLVASSLDALFSG
jgi:hypothetical protein